MTEKWKSRPSEPAIEYALLIWWKIIMIEMPGNSCWKHSRDYKAVITLLKKWLEYEKDEAGKHLLSKLEDEFAESNSIDWRLLEDLRVAIHNFLAEHPEYNPAPEFDPLESLTLAEPWAVQRIRELTDS